MQVCHKWSGAKRILGCQAHLLHQGDPLEASLNAPQAPLC